MPATYEKRIKKKKKTTQQDQVETRPLAVRNKVEDMKVVPIYLETENMLRTNSRQSKDKEIRESKSKTR